MSDRGRDTSTELSEVRTVLSRAEHALWVIERMNAIEGHDPDNDVMQYELEQVVKWLSRWRRTGRPLKNGKK